MLFDMACVRCLRVMKHRRGHQARVAGAKLRVLACMATWRLPRPQRMGATRRIWRMQQAHARMHGQCTYRQRGPSLHIGAIAHAHARPHTHARTASVCLSARKRGTQHGWGAQAVHKCTFYWLQRR